MNDIVMVILLTMLVICAVSVSFNKKILSSIIIFMSYSSIMAVIWLLLESPDLAITEAAVGAGVTSVLFFITLKKLKLMNESKKNSGEGDGKNP